MIDGKFAEKLFLTRKITDYHLISQAEVTIDGMNDKEEMQITDVIYNLIQYIFSCNFK